MKELMARMKNIMAENEVQEKIDLAAKECEWQKVKNKIFGLKEEIKDLIEMGNMCQKINISALDYKYNMTTIDSDSYYKSNRFGLADELFIDEHKKEDYRRLIFFQRDEYTTTYMMTDGKTIWSGKRSKYEKYNYDDDCGISTEEKIELGNKFLIKFEYFKKDFMEYIEKRLNEKN